MRALRICISHLLALLAWGPQWKVCSTDSPVPPAATSAGLSYPFPAGETRPSGYLDHLGWRLGPLLRRCPNLRGGCIGGDGDAPPCWDGGADVRLENGGAGERAASHLEWRLGPLLRRCPNLRGGVAGGEVPCWGSGSSRIEVGCEAVCEDGQEIVPLIPVERLGWRLGPLLRRCPDLKSGGVDKRCQNLRGGDGQAPCLGAGRDDGAHGTASSPMTKVHLGWRLGPLMRRCPNLRGGGGDAGHGWGEGGGPVGVMIASDGRSQAAAFDRLASEAVTDGRHEWAMYLYNRSADLHPNASSLSMLAQLTYEVRGDAGCAYAACERALLADPSSAPAAKLLARLHLPPARPPPGKNMSQALDLLTSVVAADPSDAEAACLLLSLSAQNCTAQDIKALASGCRAAISRCLPGPSRREATHMYANALRDAGQWSLAHTAYKSLLSSEGSPEAHVAANPDVMCDLAKLHAAKGDSGAAAELYQHVLAASPNHLGASVGLACMPGDVVSDTDAEGLLRRAVSTSPRSIAAHASLTWLLGVRRGDWDAAASHASHAARLHPSSPDLAAWSSLSLHQSGDIRAAEAAYRKELLLSPTSPTSLYNLASLLQTRMLQGDAEEAQNLYRTVISLGPSPARAAAAFNLGVLIGPSQQGAEALSMAYGLRPSHVPTLTAYAGSLLAMGDAPKSASVYYRATRAAPDSADALIGYAKAQCACEGGQGEAMRAYRSAAAMSPANPEGLAGLASLLQDVDGAFDEAMSLYESALAVSPGHAASNYGLALCLEQKGDASAAESAYLSAVSSDPAHTNAWNNLGRLREVAGGQGAKDAYERALLSDPSHVTSMYNYGSMLQSDGDYAGAEVLYRRALSASEGGQAIGGVLCNYGLLLEEWKRDYDGAEELYKRALKIDPADTFALSNYASMLADSKGDAKGAVGLYQRVLAVMPGDAATLTSLGATHEKLGEADRAEALYQDAVMADPAHVPSLTRYAQFLGMERGDRKGAVRLLKKALHLDPDNSATTSLLGNM